MKPTRRPRGAAIDWQQVRQRLAQASARAQQLSPERARAILDERARALARAPAQAAPAAEVLSVTTFSLANEHYGIETRHVREVVRFTDYTPIPGAPDFLVGVFNLRGEILAVIDLRKFFGIAERGLTDLARVLVLGGERAEFGVLADEVHEVLRLRTDEVFDPPGTSASIGRSYLRGVTQDALVLLDGGALLQDGRLFIDQAEESGG